MKLSRTLFTLTASVGLVLAAAPQVAAEPAQTPLYLLGGVDPNIMFIIDDSGSMNLAFVPDTLCSLRTTKRVKSAAVNTLYYDRNVTYPAPLNHDNSSLGDASFTAAWTNGYDLAGRASSTVNLSTSFRPNWSGSTTGCSDSSTYAHTTVEAAYYYVFDSTNTSCDGTLTDDDCYDKVVVSSTSGPSSSDERTNFANWYSYYRTRLLTTKAGASRAFAPQGTSIRVGYGRINDGTATSIDSVSVTTIVRGVRPFSSTDRQDFFTWLFGLGTQTYTPLRRALDDAGKYFSSGGTDGPWSSTPGTTGGTLASCRQSFTILTTDGYWNDAQASTAAARDNNDGSAGPTVTGPASTSYTYSAVSPFTDSRSNTLADVAMYYWKRDLLSSVANRVPTTTLDPAFWQHMVTFGLGLGVPTAISPTAAFDAITTGASITWPDPVVSDTDPTSPPAARIDDLLHAAVNSRGGFFNADEPESFASAIKNILSDITEQRGSAAAAVATNSTRLNTATVAFQAKFNSTDWSGQLLAYEIDEDGSVVPTPKWNTDSTITTGTRASLSSGGKIKTYKPGTGEVAFSYSSLSAKQKCFLDYLDNTASPCAAMSDADTTFTAGDGRGSDRVTWLQGQAVTGMRARSKVLGDVVNSDPIFVWAENFGYIKFGGSDALGSGTAYTTYLAAKALKTPMLYVGGNDGMLHALNADTGAETYTYVPNALFPKLGKLTNTSYAHQYYVDGTPNFGDACLATGSCTTWGTYLVGSLGAGGRGVFALDITDPTNIQVLWEKNHLDTDFSDLGYNIGAPQIVRAVTPSGQKWVAIFGNGYESGSGKAFLFIVDLKTGALLQKVATDTSTGNGLSAPAIYDGNGTRIIGDADADAIYAGDLQGNVWKFKYAATAWALAYPSAPLFIAMRSTVRQPITSPLEIGAPSGGLAGTMIYFGTGRYINTGDPGNLAVQSLYGIWDEGTTAITSTDRSQLQQQTIVKTIMDAMTQSSVSSDRNVRVVSNTAFTYSLTSPVKRGWYLDLIPETGTAEGERVVSTPLLRHNRAIFTTLVPSSDVCVPGGTSWLMEMNALSGGRLDYSVFNLDKDLANLFDSGDYVQLDDGSWVPATGINYDDGIIKAPAIVSAGNVEYKITSSTSSQISVLTEKGSLLNPRSSWREILGY